MFWRKKKPADNQPQPNDSQALEIPDHEFQGNVVVMTEDGRIGYKVNSADEARLAMKQLKLHKKQINLEKRQVAQSITAINAERKRQLASQGRMVRGGGSIGKFTRSMQGAARDIERANHAARLRPYEMQKAQLDQNILVIDGLIAKLEMYLLQHTD